MQSIAVAIVRNCHDIVALSVLHHVRLGVDRCIVIDNGSTDGTLEILQAIATKLPNVEVRSDASDFQQAEMTNAVINEYTRREKTLVIPFDADEFWDGSADAIAEHLQQRGVNTLSCPVVTFVQSRSVAAPTRLSWLRAYRRMTATCPCEKSLVTERQHSFVEIEYPRKVLFCAAGEVIVQVGAHGVAFIGNKAVESDAFVCLHLPLRAKSDFVTRGLDHEPRRQPYRRSSDDSWQSTHFREVVLADETEAEWRANSYGAFGMVDVFASTRSTLVDLRLVKQMCLAYGYARYLRHPCRYSVPIYDGTNGQAEPGTWLKLRLT